MRIQYQQIVRVCTFVSFILILLLSFTSILAIADGIFGWDIFPRGVEQVLMLFMAGCVIVILSSLFLTLMINLNRIADGVSRIANHMDNPQNPDNHEA